MTLSAVEVSHLKQAPAIEGVLPVVLNRWSPRSFADRDVSTNDLKKLFEAARWAPSSYNALALPCRPQWLQHLQKDIPIPHRF